MLVPPLRILILSDDVTQQAIAVSMLKALGCEVVYSATSINHALHILRNHGPVDIAICDLHLAGVDSLDFLQRSAQCGLVRSVIIRSSLMEDVSRAAKKLIPLLGIRLLGDVGSPLQIDVLASLLQVYMQQSKVVPHATINAARVCEEEVRSAMVNGQMETYFQPKVNMVSSHVYGVEALTRWRHPERGFIPPAVFMPTMEHCNYINELFFRQLGHGLQLQRYFLTHGRALSIAFNLQPSQLADPGLIHRIKAALAKFRLPGAGVIFELTEMGLVETSATCMENLVRLRMVGCGLSIDDFGNGFSSLQRLCQLPFNEIKLDAEFVRTLDDGPRSKAVISSTLALGETLDMTVVVEGIETRCQHHQLIDLGCEYGQGYYFAKPMHVQSLCNWLHSGCPSEPESSDSWSNDFQSARA